MLAGITADFMQSTDCIQEKSGGDKMGHAGEMVAHQKGPQSCGLDA